jgi:hypothetical protein
VTMGRHRMTARVALRLSRSAYHVGTGRPARAASAYHVVWAPSQIRTRRGAQIAWWGSSAPTASPAKTAMRVPSQRPQSQPAQPVQPRRQRWQGMCVRRVVMGRHRMTAWMARWPSRSACCVGMGRLALVVSAAAVIPGSMHLQAQASVIAVPQARPTTISIQAQNVSLALSEGSRKHQPRMGCRAV